MEDEKPSPFVDLIAGGFWLALAIAIMVGGSISGGHFNPAVTIMMYAAGKLSRSDLIPYLIVQIAGGLVALELYKRFKF